MRPFERLRYLARASGEDAETLLEESADCLSGFADDPMGIVIACRRLLAYHPTVTPLWWLCARTLTAAEPLAEAWRCVEAIEDDTTADELAMALPDDATVCVVGWPDLVAQAGEQPRPMMCPGARLHAHQARRRAREDFDHFRTAQPTHSTGRQERADRLHQRCVGHRPHRPRPAPRAELMQLTVGHAGQFTTGQLQALRARPAQALRTCELKVRSLAYPSRFV